MTPTTDQKVYTLILPDGRKESWSQEMYDAKNAKLYDKYRDAEVYSSQSYNPDSTYSDNAYYQISVDGREPELWTSDMFRQKGAKLREKLPDARIDVITDESTDYWSKRREEAMRRLTDFDAANKAFMSQHERDTIAYRDDAPMFMDEPTYIENDARYTQLAKERENLLYDINNNPLNVNQYKLGTNAAESNIAKYSAIMRKMVNENPDILRYGFKDLEFDKYQKAIKLEEDIAKLYSVDIKNPNDDFAKKFANFVKGHKDTFTDVDFWSRGLTAIDRDLSVRNIFKRLEKQGNNLFEMSAEQIESSLTDGEKALISAFLRLGQAMSARKDDLAAGYNAGKTSAESLGYMAEFLLSGAIGRAAGTALKGSGKAAQSGLMRYLAKELRGEAGSAVTSAVRRGLLQTATKQGTSKALSAGAKAAINATAKAAGKAYEFVAQPVLQTLRQTPLMPSTYRNIADGLTALDNNGDLVEAGDAIFGQVLDSLIENWSESMGEAVNWGLSLVPRGVTAAGSKVLANTTPAQWAKWIAESGGWRVLKQSGFHGLVGEMGEEWLGNAARLGLGLIDQKEWDQFASLNSQLEMAAAFAPMTLIGLGTSSAAIARESKHYAKASEAMKSVLNKHGWTQEEIDNLFGTRRTRAEINEALTPTLQRIVKESVGNPAAAGDYRAVLDFVQAASVKEVLDNVQALERENMRKQESDLIGAELGATTSDDARGKFSYNKVYDTPSGQYEMETVTELKDKFGNISYIVGEDEANYIIRETQDPSTPVIIDKTSFAEKLEKGDYEARTMLKHQYLDERISTKQQVVEQQLADESYRELINAVNTQMAPGTPISVNVGDTEAQGVVLSVGRDGVIVDFGTPVDLNGVSLQVHKLSLEQAGRILGVESKQKSQAQIDADQAAEDELNRETVRNLNNAMRGRQFMQGDELYTYVRVFDAPSVDESGNKVVNVTATNSNGEDVTITMPLDELKTLGMDEQSRAELDAANEESGQQVADSHADVERDFRGNEIPMRTNEKTGQREVDKRAFKAADPEAYYRWNDSRRGGDTTDSMEALKADIAAKSEQLGQLQTQKRQETDPDKRDELEEAITAITNETNLLSGIYYKYDAASNFKDRQKDYLAKLTDINNRLLNSKTQTQADELLEMRRDALREYYGQMQEAAMTVTNNQWAVSLQDELNKIADVPVQVVTGANVEEVMITDGASQAAIDKVLDKQAEIERIFVETGKRFAMTGFHNDGKVYIFAEGNPDLESATRSYYHERQHSINQQSDVSVAQIETHFNGDTATMYNALESIIGDARVYADADARTLADELSAFSMELAWTRPDWAEFLKSKGLDEEFINIIGTEYGRQTGTSEDLDNGSGDRVARDSGSGPADNQSDEQAAEGASGNEQLGPAYDGAATEEVGESAEPELTEDQKKALGILNGEMPEQGVAVTEDGRVSGVVPKIKKKLDLYKFVLSEKEPTMPISGVYHDKGVQVASDGRVLVATQTDYAEELEGSITNKKGNVIPGKYPAWKNIVSEMKGAIDTDINPDELAAFVSGVRELMKKRYPKAKEKTYRDTVRIKLMTLNGVDIFFRADVLERYLEAARSIGGPIKISDGKFSKIITERGNNLAIAISSSKLPKIIRDNYFDYETGREYTSDGTPVEASGVTENEGDAATVNFSITEVSDANLFDDELIMSRSAKAAPIQGLESYTRDELKQLVENHIASTLSENNIDAEIVDVKLHGSRGRGTAREDSDLDAVVEYRGDIREDSMFNMLNDEDTHLVIDGISVDINPIRAEETGTMESYMKRSRDYDEQKIQQQVALDLINGIATFKEEGGDIRFSIRTKPAPKNTGIGYKVFYFKDGKLYPPMVANPGGLDTPVGVWLDADAAPQVATSKTGRMKVKAGGKGTQGGSGTLAYRPGWHLGEIPYALQFNRGPKVDNPQGVVGKNGKVIKVGKYFPKNFVWAEVEYAKDVDYQEEAMSYGYNEAGNFQHSLAGLPKVPVDGSYTYRTNANPATDPWIITGAMKVNRILTDSEVDDLVRQAGREPQLREGKEEISRNENGNNEIRFRIVNTNQQVFISNALASLDKISMKSGNAQAWINKIQQAGGLKKEEDKWMGLTDWIKEQKGNISKEDVAEFIREHQIQIEEVKYAEMREVSEFEGLDFLTKEYNELLDMYAEEDNPEDYAQNEMEARHGRNFWVHFFVNGEGEIDVAQDSFDTFDEMLTQLEKYDVYPSQDVNPINSIRLDYTTEGLQDNREIALVVPTIEPYNENDQIHFGDAGEGRAVAWIRFGSSKYYIPEYDNFYEFKKRMTEKYFPGTFGYNIPDLSKLTDEERAEYDRLESIKKSVPMNKSRGTVLVIDEIQSKRHQDGKEKSYRSQFNKSELDAARKASHDYGTVLFEKYIKGQHPGEDFLDYATAEEKQKFNELTERVSELVRMEYNGVPDAPFRDSWDALAMKRMLRLAAEEGYDKIAWTSGQMQSDRYNLTKVLGDFYYKPNGDGTYKVSAALNQRRTGYTDYSDLNYDSLTVDRIGEIFGKEIAVKVSEGKGRKGYSHNNESDWITFSGRDLKMANEGMRYFYDQKLVNWMNKYGKKWGVQVADLTLLGLENKEGWHSVDVTPEMKESVMEGQPMFRATEVSGNPSLIAVHNLNEKNLLDAFDLGGFPMPSIAITKSDIGHTNFGEISLVFDKETIDPKNRKNKVFSEDAWTPMFPKIGYKLNYDKTSEIYRRAIDVGALPLFNSSNFNRVNYEDEIDDMQAKSLIDKFKKDYGAKQFFLAEQGNPVREYEMHEVDKYTERQEKRFKDLLDNIGLERLKSALPNLNPEIIREVKRIVDVNDNVEDSAFSRVARRFVLNAIDYATNGNKQSEVDLDSTKRKIDERIDQGTFEKWIEDMFSGIVENRGIRNEVEPYTSIGNRRAWEKLYDEVTLDNVVKAMSKKPKRGGSGFFGGNIFGAAAKTYNSISDIRKDAAIRLAAVKPEEIDKQKQAILDRLSKVKVTNRELSISEMFDLTENIKDAVAKSHTAEGIHRYLKDYYPDITMDAAQEIEDIVKDIQSISTKYFEAKPYRAVGFDEVKLAVVPEDASQAIVDGLKERGVPVRTYENGNQQERMDIISNATEEMGLRFRTVEITPEVRKEMDDIIAKAKENGTYLKAPNGADTNLTPEQWAMVRTSAFKNWFGDWENDQENASKALDENGEPRVFYHGTNWDALNEPKGGATFDIRNLGTASGDAGFFGSGHYFAFTKAEAGFYGRNMIEAFLNLRNPFYYNEAFTNYNGKYLGSLNPARESMEFINLGKLFPEIAKDYKADAYEGSENVTSFNAQEYAEKFDEVYNNKKFIVEEDKNYPSGRVVVKSDPITIQHENGYTWTEYGYQKTIAKPSSEEGYDIQAELTHWYLTEPSDNTPYLDDAKVIEGIYEPHVEYKLPNLHYAFEGNAFSEAVKAKGYDGVFQSAVGDEAVAFEPNQIKSATDNTGEFSRENDDIRFRVEFTPSEIASMETPILFSKGTFKNLEEAEKWAMQNLSGRGETNMFTGELVTISRKSIREMLAPKFSKKVGEEVHMSALMSVLDFIKTGIPAEVHPDTHGRGFDVIRLYNAFSNNEKIYRVKSTIKRLKEGDRYYTYEMQEMELIEDMQNALGLNSNPVLNSTDSISGAKLLKGVKKTNSNETILSFRITPAQDAEYMSAVESGDMVTADRMVRDAAMAAGYNLEAYHGTDVDFNEFKLRRHTNGNIWGSGFYFADSEDAAAGWGERAKIANRSGDYKVLHTYLSVHNPFELYSDRLELGLGEYAEDVISKLDPEYDADIIESIRTETPIDDYRGEANDRIAEAIHELGFDAIQGYYYDEYHTMVFSPNQVKSADPVTYDDNGNIIPLSQRFNPESNDIRFRTVQQTPPEVGFREAATRSRMFTGNMDRSDVFDTMMDVYAALPEEVRQDIVRLAPVNGYNLADATARFFSDIASREDMSEKDIELVSTLRDTIEKRYGDMGLSLQDALWIVYNNTNKADDFVSLARHTMIASRLGHMPKDELDKKGIENGVNFSIIESARSSSAAYMYNESTAFWGNRLKESYVDMFESVNDLVAAIETATGSKAQSFEDIRLALNQQSSKGLDRMNDYIEKYMKPMWDAIGDLSQYGQHYGDVVLYVMYKHGLERNDVLARRDAKRFYKEQLDNILADLNKQRQQAENELKNATTQSEKDAAQIKLDDLQSQIDTANQSYDRHIKMTDNGTSAKYKEFREQDYSGIMAMHYHYEGLLPRESYRSERDYQAARLQATKPDYDNLADAEAASLAYINAFESSVGKDAIDNLWGKINAATKKTLEDQYKSNMLSKQQYEHIKGMFNYYVPLRGFDDVTAQDIWQYYNVGKEGAFTPAVLAAKGRKSKAEDPFKWIGTMASSAIAQDVKNESKLALYYFVANRPNQDLVSIRDVWYEYDDAATLAYQAQNPGSKRRIFSASYPNFNESLAGDAAKQAYDTWEESMKQKAKQGLAYRSSNTLGVKDDVVFISKPEQEQHVIRMNLRGKRVELYVNGAPRAAQAINGVFNVERKEGYENIFGPFLRWMSAVNTSYNPEFWISNAQRDLLFSFMASDIKGDGAFKFLSSLTSPVKIMRMMKDYKAGTLGNSPLETYYREFAEGGAITGFTVVKGNEVWEKEIKSYLEPSMAKRVLEATRIDKFLGFFHNLGEAVEQMCRFAAFVNARESGKDITEAVNDAKEISVNFNRKGSGQPLTMEEIDRLTTKDGKELNYAQKLSVFIASLVPAYGRRVVMFFNAAVQGLNAVYKLWTKDKRRTMAWAAGYFAVGAITAMLHAMLDDDDDYLDMPDYTRRNNLLIGGGGIYLKWALPQEARMFYAMGDMAVGHAMGRYPHKNMLGEMANAIADVMPLSSTSGIKGLAPSFLQPFLDIVENKDFTGGRVYNDLKYLSDAEKKATPRYSVALKGTDMVFVGISEALNFFSGGNQYEAGMINIPPEIIQHVTESIGGGLFRTVDKTVSTAANAVGAAIGNENAKELFSIRRFPFLNRVLELNDERTRNSHITDVYYYYSDEMKKAKNVLSRMKKSKDKEALEKYKETDSYKIYEIFEKHKKQIKKYDEALKMETSAKNRKRLMREQDELRRKIIEEISYID